MPLSNPENKEKFNFQRTVAIVGVILFVGKLIAWQLTNSDAVFSDAMESTVNIIAAFMGLYSLYLASKPRDEDHPYGHGKIEFVTSGIEGALIILAGIMIDIQAVNSLINGNEIKKLDWGIFIVAITAGINYLMGYISIKKGEKMNSIVLISSGKHLQSDTLTTVGVVLSLVLVYFTKLNWLDSAVALVFGTYIMFVGYKIVRKALSGIMDEADPNLLIQIVKILNANRKTEWIDVHNMKVQQYGSGIHMDAHITLPYYYSLKDAHSKMEEAIKSLAAEMDRSVEFNFHMDDCKPTSCPLCEINCPMRVYPFEKKIDWTIETVSQIHKHSYPVEEN